MTTGQHSIQSLLATVGISVNVYIDETRSNLIVMETGQFVQLRDWVQERFTPIVQDANYTYLRERLADSTDIFQ